MPVHPIIRAQLDLAVGKAAYDTLPLAEARAAARKPYLTQSSSLAVARVRNFEVPGPAGPVPVRLYTPFEDTPRPLIAFFHGSGFTLLDLDTHDDMCRRLCVASGCVVASVDYRLAPEHPFPAGPDDCIAATRWLAAHAGELGCRTGPIGLAGDSAGGCLAIATALQLRDDGESASSVRANSVPIGALLMWYPCTDHPSAQWPSHREFAEGYGLSAAGMRWFWDQYLGADPDAALIKKASPLRVESLAGLPPTWIATAEYDVLRDEGEAFAERLRAQGVSVELSRALGLNHGFLKYLDVIETATDSMKQAAQWMRARLGS